jgi:hypothetical protein
VRKNEKIKSIIGSGLMALAVAAPASAQSANIEMSVNDRAAMSDTKISVPIKGPVSLLQGTRLQWIMAGQLMTSA